MKGLTLSYVLFILESSYRKQLSPLSLFISKIDWIEISWLKYLVFEGVLSTKGVLSPISARVFGFCKWNEMSYLTQQFAEDLNSITLPTFYHNALNVYLPEIASISLATVQFRRNSKELQGSIFLRVSFQSQRGRTLLADHQCSDVHSLK